MGALLLSTAAIIILLIPTHLQAPDFKNVYVSLNYMLLNIIALVPYVERLGGPRLE